MTQSTVAGTCVVAVRLVGSYPYSAPAVYRATARRDGVLVWRLVESPLGYFRSGARKVALGYRTRRNASAAAVRLASERGLRVEHEVRHGRVCT